MSNTLKKGELFAKEVIARLKGDNQEALGNKIARKAVSAFEVQIAGIKGKIVEAEVAVENAEESLKNAMYPTVLFSDGTEYCSSIARAKETLNVKTEELSNLNENLKFYTEMLDKF
jgi:hypothetical protein